MEIAEDKATRVVSELELEQERKDNLIACLRRRTVSGLPGRGGSRGR